jgi:hypothetical protein
MRGPRITNDQHLQTFFPNGKFNWLLLPVVQTILSSHAMCHSRARLCGVLIVSTWRTQKPDVLDIWDFGDGYTTRQFARCPEPAPKTKTFGITLTKTLSAVSLSFNFARSVERREVRKAEVGQPTGKQPIVKPSSRNGLVYLGAG